MFDLDQAIIAWRQKMAAGGVKAPAVLDELESHLREEVERQTRSGVEVAKAFGVAVEKIGPASALKKEFKKSVVSAVLEKVMLGMAVLWVALGIFLSVVTAFLCYLTPAERITSLIATGMVILAACAWPAFVPRMPVIAHQWKRQGLEIACLVAGIALGTFYCQVIMPHFEHDPGTIQDRIIPAIGFFCLFPVAVGLGAACALESAARRNVQTSA